MRKGAAGSSSMVSASRITPGIASGATLPQLRAPALPYEQPRPGSSRSISVTSAPRRRRCHAVHTPTMPAPITTTASPPLRVMAASIEHDVRVADHAAEPLGLLPDEGAELGWGVRHHVGAELREPCAHARIRQDGDARAVQRV